MDFNDKKVKDMNNEYMFGKSILVAPVVNAQYTPETIVKSDAQTGWDKKDATGEKKNSTVNFAQAKSMKVYLPEGTVWYDFWTNEKISGGQEIVKAITIDEIPLYIKSGSIIPFGPQVQYATEKKWDDLEIRVYGGANGEFTLYEDENDNYNYEKGAYSTITFTWNDAKKVLTISNCKGSFPGMLAERKFKIRLVAPGKNTSDKYDKVIVYKGKKVVTVLP
jgi:alpha-D-xyloside xylohydrolase